MKKNNLYLPALRCRIGDWIYYLTSMRLVEVASRVRPVTDMHTSASLNTLLQREITDRKDAIAKYLIDHNQRFFNSIVVGVYGGNPVWIDIAIDPQIFAPDVMLDEDASRINESLGLLYLSGDESLFAIDGQHRVEGIREALRASSSLSVEEIGVIFVAHHRDQEGIMRTRRLFSTLNRYAKPVSLGEIVALDEDDTFAIVTRRLMNEHPLLSNDKAKAYKQVSIPSSDKVSFTTMLTVYNISVILCDKLRKGWTKKALMSTRPSDEVINDVYEICYDFWNNLASSFKEVDRVRKEGNIVASLFRREDGGHLLFRPVGQMTFARAIRTLMNDDVDMQTALGKLANLPYELSVQPWIGVLWNPAAKNMITNITNQKIAADLLLYYSGYLSKNQALTQYRKAVANTEATLPKLPS